MAIVCALCGLIAFLCHDFEAIGSLKGGVWRSGFAVGIVLWGMVFGQTILLGVTQAALWQVVGFGIPAIICFGFEVYALFFALPFEDTYVHPQGKRRVCRSGIYKWCRHPGFWSFLGICLFSALALGCAQAWINLSLLALLNGVYIVVQDRWIFVREFEDYRDYQREVPFLWPAGRGRPGKGGRS